jgi:lipid-A-disaccharide synthase
LIDPSPETPPPPAAPPGGPLIFISAAEPSADLHAAALIEATVALCPSVRFVGVAGPRMVEAGCHAIFDMTRHAAMLLGVIGAAGRAARMMRISDACLRRFPFDAAVVLDSPMLHLPLAGRAQAAGVPVLYYIAPQLWAWGARRIHKLRNRVESVAAILPFEEAYFRDRGVPATFVGHPLIERLRATAIDPGEVNRIRAGADRMVGILPGSRRHVVEEVLPGQLDVARRIAEAMPDVRFAASVANPQVSAAVAAAMRRAGVSVASIAGPPGPLIAASDLVLVASGTATLEVAYHHRPMIVMYNASRLFYHLIGRWMLRTPHLSLPNILAGREIVPEFMPYYNATEPIARRAIQLLESPERRKSMSTDLESIITPLANSEASTQTARMLLDLTHARH